MKTSISSAIGALLIGGTLFALSGCAGFMMTDITISPAEAALQIETHTLQCRRDLVWASMKNGDLKKLRVKEKTKNYISGPSETWEDRGKEIKVYFKDMESVELRKFTAAACIRM
jgi:hypothetical protein